MREGRLLDFCLRVRRQSFLDQAQCRLRIVRELK
jgi:hypothetical protein